MVEPTKPDEADPKASAIAALLSDKDSLVKLVTLALVVFSGAGNFFATRQAGDNSQAEQALAIREIHEIHAVIDASIQRQKEIHDMLEKILSSQKPGTQ
jgi:hypothetical protein